MVRRQRVSAMTAVPATVETPSGKWRNAENFPVGSLLIRRDLRAHVHAFYRFARNADDIADNPGLTADEKVRLLDRLTAIPAGPPPPPPPTPPPIRPLLLQTPLPAPHSPH